MFTETKCEGEAVSAPVHPSVSAKLTAQEIAVMRVVRDDLAAGRIERKMFNMRAVPGCVPCGSPCCMAGHMAERLGIENGPQQTLWFCGVSHSELAHLFAAHNPSDPARAVRAIDHYLATGCGTWPK
jgi:hypothetical protein